MHVVCAFLNGDLLEEVYIKQYEGYSEGNDLVCRIHKSLYGFKQAPRSWYKKYNLFISNDLKK